MSNFSKRALRWAAPVALVGALGLAACGDNDDSEAVRVAAPSAAGLGSDQHLNNKAEEIARASASAASEQQLGSRTPSASVPLNWPEDLARRAILKAEAERYVDQLQDRAAANSSGTSNRAAQQAQADAYVESLEARADSGQAESAVKSYGYVAPRVDDGR